ncbi:MAG: LTA synthase family protein [Bacilli bacterium]|nr:LTA synthase family protein [Bacilli bacterium]
MKEKLEKQIFKHTIIFFIYIFTIELIIRFNLSSNFFNYATLRIAISSLILALIVSLILNIGGSLFKKITASIIGVFLIIYAWVETNLYFYLGLFMGLGNAEQGTKVIDYIREYIIASKLGTYLIIIPFILLLLYYWYLEPKLTLKKLEKTTIFYFKPVSYKRKVLVYISIIIFLILSSITYYGTLKAKFMQNKMQTTKNISLFIYPENSNLAVSQLGIFTYGLSDLISCIFNLSDLDLYEYELTSTKHQTQVSDYSRNIDDTLWENIIEKENNNTHNKLSNYFINQEITPKNDYTGIFEGKNLIFILMESVGEIAINETFFPNIYKLYNEGFAFTNNYSPRNSCATGNNELTSMTSLYTINNTCTANTYMYNNYFQSIFNQFNNIGYHTSSYHNYPEFYYSRKIIHPKLGSSAFYNATDLGIKWSALYEEWPSDVELIEKSLPYFINEDQFMVYMTTVTSHQPYGVSSEYGNKYLSELEEYDYRLPLKRYISKVMELDKAIGELIKLLKKSGKLDDTVIVLTGDHYPYGLSSKYINQILEYDVEINNEVDRTPLIIYNHSQEPEKIDKYTSVIDILPTILNLFNVNYDPRFYFGDDIFSDYDDRVVFADGSWQDSSGFYNAPKAKFISAFDDETDTYSDEKLIEINYEISTKKKMSSLAIKNYYFSYLEMALEKEKAAQAEEE